MKKPSQILRDIGWLYLPIVLLLPLAQSYNKLYIVSYCYYDYCCIFVSILYVLTLVKAAS